MTAEDESSWPPPPDVPRAVAPGIRHLLAPNASSWTYEGTNSYVLADGDSAILIDPGCTDESHAEALRQAGRAGGLTVAAVLLTHDHPDHSDGARALADSLGAPLIAMSRRFADEPLADGQVLRIGELEAHVLHTPGHSDDSVCLWLPRQEVLLTGDTLLGAKSSGVLGRISELLASLELLRRLVGDRPVLALPGHGPAFDDIAASAGRVIAVRTRRIDEVRGHIDRGTTSLEELTRLLYPSHAGSRAMFATSTVVSTVRYLAEQTGERGIGDARRRDEVVAELTRYDEAMAERSRVQSSAERSRVQNSAEHDAQQGAAHS